MNDLRGNRHADVGGSAKTVKIIGAVIVAGAIIAAASFAYSAATTKPPVQSFPKSFNSSSLVSPVMPA